MPATIFSGTKVKTLKDTLSLNGGADVISSTVDPSAVATSANAGSLLLNTTTGNLYRKTDNGSTTNWILMISSSALSAPLSKNYVINGDFNIWQRGGTRNVTSGTSFYEADRFLTYVTSGNTVTIDQTTFALGQTDVPDEPSFYHRATAVASSVAGTRHVIESVKTLAGKTVTLSFYAKAATSQTITAQMVQNFGLSGSGEVISASQNASLTTAWQKFTLTFVLPSISGKIISGFDSLQILFTYPAGAAFVVDIAHIMLNEGSSAAPWQHASGGSSCNLEKELAMCLRYYWRTGGGGASALVTGYCRGTTSAQGDLQYPVPMYTAPTLNPSAANAIGIDFSTAGTNSTAISRGIETVYACRLVATATGLVNGQACIMSTNSGQYLEFYAELY